MSSYTKNLNLLKKDPVTDGSETFNIKTMMNDNWDKIDEKIGDISDNVKKIELQMANTYSELMVTTNPGVSVTASLNGKIVNAVADSSGLAILKLSGFGTWTISATINGESISIDLEIKGIAQYSIALSTDLETASWSVIDAVSKSGKASSLWSVGDKKTVNIEGKDYQVQIIGFNHDMKTDGEKAGITFQMVDCLDYTFQMNPQSSTNGGWRSCMARTSNMKIIFNKLPYGLQKAIKNVKKLTSSGGSTPQIYTTIDNLFFLSEIEIFGSVTNSLSGEGSQYAYYQAGNSRIKKVNESESKWHTRSPSPNQADQFCVVEINGNTNTSFASYKQGASIAFCV